ncbi:MAG: diguanylate cyclase [Gammaproteobacteria bacterium]|nr:diguanylate cyclase [Gammaproteobacteria bacterium]
MKILVVDDNNTDRLVMNTYLLRMGYEVVLGGNGLQAVELYKENQPDLVVMDVNMPEMNGYDAAQKIRQISDEWIPIIFLSARIGSEDIVKGIEAGGDDYLVKPIDHQVLEAKMKAMQRIAEMRHKLVEMAFELKQANAELKQLVNIDGLTGLFNRRYLDDFLVREVARSKRYQQSLTVILCDIDYFKVFNDTYGHLEGDDCLRGVSAILKNSCRRPTDLVARYGGEEFAIILSDMDSEAAVIMAETIREAIEAEQIPHKKSLVSQVVTMSLGVCSLIPEHGDTPETFLQKADVALYQAKQAGRNQVKMNA